MRKKINKEKLLRSFIREVIIAEGHGSIINDIFGIESNGSRKLSKTSNPATAILIKLIESERTNLARGVIPLLKLAAQRGSHQARRALPDAQDYTDQTDHRSKLGRLVKQAYDVRHYGDEDLAAAARQHDFRRTSKYLEMAKEFIRETRFEEEIFFNLYELAGISHSEAQQELERLRAEKQDQS